MLTEHLVDEEGTPTRAALDQTLAFFREKLGVGAGPAPGPTACPVGLRPPPAGSRRSTRSPERTAPSMAPYDVDAVSVPAQCSRPTGSRRRRPYWVSTPVGKWPMEQPRVQCSSAQFCSRTSTGEAAAGPRRAAEHAHEHLAALRLAEGGQGAGTGTGRVPGHDPLGMVGLAGVERDLDVVVGGHGGARHAVVPPEGLVVDGHHLDLGAGRHLVDQQRVVRRERGVEADAGRQGPRQGQDDAPGRHGAGRARAPRPGHRLALGPRSPVCPGRRPSPSSAAMASGIWPTPPSNWASW